MNLDKQIYFVTGIDTDAGKSFATGYIASQLRNNHGKNAITQKLIQTGCHGISEDIELHRKIMNIELLPEDKDLTTCPIVMSYPCSPHLASKIDNTAVDLKLIDQATLKLSNKYEIVLIEGAGGLMVPILEDYLTADFIAQRNYPVILVTSSKLGSINHTLLTLEICRNRGINVAALAFNHYPCNDKTIAESTLDYFQKYINEYHPGCQVIEIPHIDM